MFFFYSFPYLFLFTHLFLHLTVLLGIPSSTAQLKERIDYLDVKKRFRDEPFAGDG